MAISKTQKRILIISGIIVLVFALAIIIVNLILGTILEGKIQAALDKSEDKEYNISIDGASINILSGNIRFKGITMES